MSGVVFAISIPTEEQEATVLEKLSVKFSENERKMQEDKLRKTSPIRHSMKKVTMLITDFPVAALFISGPRKDIKRYEGAGCKLDHLQQRQISSDCIPHQIEEQM